MPLKFTLKIIFTLLCIYFLVPRIAGQETDIYSLLTERYVDRPINIHRGQIQVNTGYKLSILNKKFDPDGKTVNLAKDGSAAMGHVFPVETRFGILEHLQFTAGINYARTGIRERNIWISAYDAEISIDELNEYKGLDDLNLGLSFRIPLGLKHIDWTVSGNITLPLFDHHPDKPDHNIFSAELATTYTQISYYYHHKSGTGVPTGILGSTFQISSSKVSATFSGNFRLGLAEGENIIWKSRLIDNEFDYYSEEYHFETGQLITYRALFAWQAIDWFAVLFYFDGTQQTGGWSNVTGKKIGNSPANLYYGGIGYEILVSPALRLFQTMDIPVSGKNIMGSMVIYTGISLNFISQAYYGLF